MARWHDPQAPVCTCFDCTELRYRAALKAHEAETERELAEWSERMRLDSLQLRLPMSPLPHVAHHPDRLQRARSVHRQPELI